jgi:hypothetical protein
MPLLPVWPNLVQLFMCLRIIPKFCNLRMKFNRKRHLSFYFQEDFYRYNSEQQTLHCLHFALSIIKDWCGVQKYFLSGQRICLRNTRNNGLPEWAQITRRNLVLLT